MLHSRLIEAILSPMDYRVILSITYRDIQNRSHSHYLDFNHTFITHLQEIFG